MKGDPIAYKATFETWVVKKPNALLAELPGTFTILLRFDDKSKSLRFEAVMLPTYQRIENPDTGGTWAESKSQEMKDFIKAQFKKQLTDWEPIYPAGSGPKAS